MHSILGQKGWAGKGMVKGDLLGAGMGLVLVSNGRKRDWVRNLNEKKYEVLLFFLPLFLLLSQEVSVKGKSLPQPHLSTHIGGWCEEYEWFFCLSQRQILNTNGVGGLVCHEQAFLSLHCFDLQKFLTWILKHLQ